MILVILGLVMAVAAGCVSGSRSSREIATVVAAGEALVAEVETGTLATVVANTTPGVHVTAVAFPVNLIANGTFERGDLAGWTSAGGTDGIAASTAEPHTGAWSAQLRDAAMETLVDTGPGTAYKVTAYLKIVAEEGQDWGGLRLEAQSWDWESLAHSGYLNGRAHGDAWFKVALTFTATTDRTRIQVGYYGGPGRSMLIYVDDVVVFEKGVNVPPAVQVALAPLAVDGLLLTQAYRVTGDDPDGAIVRVCWDFGDGTRSLSREGTRPVTAPGQYVATVRIADDEGAVVTQRIPWTAAAAGAPGLAIDVLAADGTTVERDRLSLAGTASGTVTSVQVSTDRGYVGKAAGTASWRAEVPLRPGLNRVLVQAQTEDGRVVAAERALRHVPDEPLAVMLPTEGAQSVERWMPLEIQFSLAGSAATHPQFPYDASPAPGLEWVDGITVDGLFTPDDWQTVYRRPAFLNQRHERQVKGGQEWLYPVGDPVWTVRFAPPGVGMWQYRIEVREAKGSVRSAEGTFQVVEPTEATNHGPIGVAPLDGRYFQFADGTPFLGGGHGIGFSPEGYSYDAVETFQAIGAGNQNLLRWWIAGQIWGSAWQPWPSRTLGYEGTVPATGLTVERAYGDGLASLKLDKENPITFQGWLSGRAGLKPGHTYRLVVRWRTEGVTGPAARGAPYGATVKLTGWPEPGETGAWPALIPHVHGDTPWHVAYADFVAGKDLLDNLSLILENTTGGAAYVDEVALYEVLRDGPPDGVRLGPQLLRSPRFNSHLTYDPRRGAGMDAILSEAAERGLYLKLVISEKQEYLLNHLAPDGLPDRNGGHFMGAEGTPSRRLHTYYWRHLFARFGAFRSVHSYELVNEADPGSAAHFDLAAALAARAAEDGNPHPATTSTWATLAEGQWKASYSAPLGYVDFHAYARGTGWIEPKPALADDSARFFAAYDAAALAADFGKPVVWGEQGIDGVAGTDTQEPLLALDREGVWLHKLTWARCGPGGVYPIYWYTDLIYAYSLHRIFGAWNRFMDGVPLANGRYEDVAARVSGEGLRVWGQKDTEAGKAHLWIDNRHHTWRSVVDGRAIPVVSGTVEIEMGRAHATFLVTWYDTRTGEVTRTEDLQTDEGGVLVLVVSSLATDVALQIAPAGR